MLDKIRVEDKINGSNYDHKYFWEDLKKKSKLGAFYQRYFLFPILSKCVTGKLIDIGAGLGDFCKFYKNSVASDVNRLAYEHYRKNNLEAELIINNKINRNDSSFDTALLDNVIEHIDNPRSLLLEIKRILKNNGILIIGVPGIKGFKNDADHKVFYDYKILGDLMLKYGFKVKNYFYTPFKSKFLDHNFKPYCLFMVFELKK